MLEVSYTAASVGRLGHLEIKVKGQAHTFQGHQCCNMDH